MKNSLKILSKLKFIYLSFSQLEINELVTSHFLLNSWCYYYDLHTILVIKKYIDIRIQKYKLKTTWLFIYWLALNLFYLFSYHYDIGIGITVSCYKFFSLKTLFVAEIKDGRKHVENEFHSKKTQDCVLFYKSCQNKLIRMTIGYFNKNI